MEKRSTMKLAEALLVRAEMQVRVASLEDRARLSARYQEGDSPQEDAAELVEEGLRSYAELAGLVAQINQTNSAHRLGNGMTMTEALAHRVMLSKQQKLLRTIAEAAFGAEESYGLRGMRRAPIVRETRSELRWVSAVPVGELRDRADRLARERRELDTMIQEANWTVELAE